MCNCVTIDKIPAIDTGHFLSVPWSLQSLRWSGSRALEHPLSSDGISTSLKPALAHTEQETSRRLSVRYDGFAQVTLHKLATGLACLQVDTPKAFPVPGRLAGSHPTYLVRLLD